MQTATIIPTAVAVPDARTHYRVNAFIALASQMILFFLHFVFFALLHY